MAASAEGVLEGLVLLAQVMQNDLFGVQDLLEPPTAPPPIEDYDLLQLLSTLRNRQT